MVFDGAVTALLREIRDRLNPDPGPAYIDRDVLSKATAVSAFARRVDGGLEIDGKDFSQYIIQSDGFIGDVSYRVKNLKADWTTEFEASRLPYVPGPVELIQFKNDGAESGKSIFVTKMKVPNLSAAPPPLPAQEPDPTFKVGGEINIGYILAGKTNPVFKTLVGRISGTNNIQTLEENLVDYAVPSGKECYIYKLDFMSAVADESIALGYGDDGVAIGTADPTNPVWLIGTDEVTTSDKSSYVARVALELETWDVLAIIPASKFPFYETSTTSAVTYLHAYGVEVDA